MGRRLSLCRRGLRSAVIRLYPRSMTGQLLGLLLGGLIAGHVIAVLILLPENRLIHPLAKRYSIERIASTYQLVTAVAPDQMATLLQSVSTPEAKFRIGASLVPQRTMSADEAGFSRDLQRKLPDLAPESIAVRMQWQPLRAGAEESPRGSAGGAARLHLAVDMQLPDGRLLSSDQWPAVKFVWWRPIRFSVPVSILPVVIVAAFFLWRMLRPTRALASAARRFSRGERFAPLPIEGPTELRDIAASFNEMQDRLTRFIDGRTRMLAAISHDFRTPITSLRVRAELIDDPSLRADMIRVLEDMRVMVEETLHFARDDAAHESAMDTDLVTLMQEVLQEQRLLGRTIAAELPASLPYRCRPVSFKRAIMNLVDNAVMHGGSARLVASLEGAAIRIDVDDDGAGIDPVLLERAFEPFARLDAARGPEGTGLGLAIAQSCIRAHGGEIQLTNRSGGGLRASVKLPI